MNTQMQMGWEQGLLPLGDSVELSAVVQTVEQLVDTRRTVPRPSRWPEVGAIQLDLLATPLFSDRNLVFDASHAASARSTAAAQARKLVSAADVPDNFADLLTGDWMRMVAKCHAGLLYRQLEILFQARSASSKARRDVLTWVYAPSSVEHCTAAGVLKLIPAVDIPFTFDCCCSIEQLPANLLRDAIAARLEEIAAGSKLVIGTLH